MRKFAERVIAAWAVLCGKPVIRGVEVRRGEVRMRHRDDLLLSDGVIEDCEVLVRGPVAFKADKTSTVGDNAGNALVRLDPHN